MAKFTAGMLKEKLDAFRSRCVQTGLKITPQRLAVYKVLLETTKHPSAEMVHSTLRRTFPCISLDTVNRTLLTLNQIEAAVIVEGSGEPKRFDANLQAHQHFKCVKCKRIIDFHHKPFDNITVPADIERKFTVLRKTVYLEGFCDLCSKKGADREKIS